VGFGSRAETSSTCPESIGGGVRRAGRAVRARRWAGLTAACAALLASPARAETQLEPIVRMGVEGGYDSNVLFDGRGDAESRLSPELGLRAFDHLFTLTGVYGLDYLEYRRLQPNGVWNHRGTLDLSAWLTPRLHLTGSAKSIYATDPVGLAQVGIFRAGEARALFLQAGSRAEYELTPLMVIAGEMREQLVRFQDQTGGAMHAPALELLHRLNERLELGGAYAFSVFQDFLPGQTRLAYAHGFRARARYMISRFLEADAFAGPALWSGTTRAVLPEAGLELRLVERDWDLRLEVGHQLGLGSTADPGLVNSIEFGTVRRFGRLFDLRGDGGIWEAGEIPSGRNATTGFAVAGEAGWHVTRQLRLAVAAAYLARLDNSSSELRRTTVGIRMGWELPAR